MDPVVYFTFFIGTLVLFLFVTVLHKGPTRPCPACGADTPLTARRCKYCDYVFTK